MADVKVSPDSVHATAINPPFYQADSYSVAIRDNCIPVEIHCGSTRQSDRIYARYCRVFNTNGKELCRPEEYITVRLHREVLIRVFPIARSVDICTTNGTRGFISPMSMVMHNKFLVTACKSAFLTEISSGLYGHGDTTIVTLENKNKDIILPENTKKLVLEVDSSLSSIVFNKNIDAIDSIGRAKIKRIGISKEASHKQLAIITKFIMDCKNIDDAEFDDNFKWKLYSKCYDILRENKSLADEIYNDVEVIVY